MHDNRSWDPDGVSAAIRRIIDYLPLTRDDLARASGVHRSQISRWATGKHRPGHDAVAGVVIAVRAAAPENETAIALASELARTAGYPQFADATEDALAATAAPTPEPRPGVVHDEHGPRSAAGLRLGERLRWQWLDEATMEYRLDCDDGSGAAMAVHAGTPRSQVLEWLRADIEMARGLE